MTDQSYIKWRFFQPLSDNPKIHEYKKLSPNATHYVLFQYKDPKSTNCGVIICFIEGIENVEKALKEYLKKSMLNTSEMSQFMQMKPIHRLVDPRHWHSTFSIIQLFSF